MNYDQKTFRGQSNSPNGEVGSQTEFQYFQDGDRLSGEYSGGSIVSGHLLGTVNPDGTLDFYYHHLNSDGILMAGRCHSSPTRDVSGRIVLKESWQWLTGDRSSGQSEVVEICIAQRPPDQRSSS
jgi:hypothetical protein